MNHQARAIGNLERRIHDAERNLFAAGRRTREPWRR